MTPAYFNNGAWIPHDPSLYPSHGTWIIHDAHNVIPTLQKPAMQVPSAFLLTDVMLALHVRFGSKLLQVNTAGDTVETLAAQEALKIKRLIQAIRYLWRSSTMASTICCNGFPSSIKPQWMPTTPLIVPGCPSRIVHANKLRQKHW